MFIRIHDNHDRKIVECGIISNYNATQQRPFSFDLSLSLGSQAFVGLPIKEKDTNEFKPVLPCVASRGFH